MKPGLSSEQKSMIRRWSGFLMCIFLTACGGSFASISGNSSDSNFSSEEGTNGTESPMPGPGFKPSICSDLSFDQVVWPENVSVKQLDAFALAMNITGSFEGHDGWSNISNNFDGQGLSLGLFNQNFGQGSLQPLMIDYQQSANNRMSSIFSASQRSSLTSMLNTWLTANGGALSKASVQSIPDTSPLDIHYNTIVSQKASNSTNQASVDWAVSQLYTGTQFKPEWLTALQNLSADPMYVSLQIEAAIKLHNKAMGYVNKYGFKTLYSYLFFFDIVVQNGGISSTTESQYLAWEKNNKNASEKTKLLQLLEYRLLVVNPIYVADVRSRKTSIINSTGTVHGSQRNYPVEYCSPTWSSSIF
jgi:hypothetical protein